MNFIKAITAIIISIFLISMTACTSMQTALEHKNLEVSSQQSSSVFMDAVPKSKKTVYINIKNTSDKQINIARQIKHGLELHGYTVVSNPNRAHYLLQANILKVGKMSKSSSQSALGGGYGSALSGLATGAAMGSFSNSGNTMIGAGLAGGLVSMAADSLVKDVNFTMITDVQISERVNGYVTEKTTSNLQNGSATKTNQTMSSRSKLQRYRTRIVSNADQVNLKFAEARPALERSLAKVISGIF